MKFLQVLSHTLQLFTVKQLHIFNMFVVFHWNIFFVIMAMSKVYQRYSLKLNLESEAKYELQFRMPWHRAYIATGSKRYWLKYTYRYTTYVALT